VDAKALGNASEVEQMAGRRSWVALGILILSAVVGGFSMTAPLFGDPQSKNGAALSFEVASVKSNTSGLLSPTGMSVNPGQLTATNAALAFLVMRAYDVQDYQISGPPWLRGADRYDIAAKAETSSSSDHMMLMLQTLLVDRFKLAVHRESKEGAMYTMVVAKNEPRLVEGKDGEESHLSDTPTNEPAQGIVRHFVGKKTSMCQLAQRLSNNLRRPVLDTTGLTRDYDFDVKWVSDKGTASSMDGYFDPLLTALQAQLGLRLEARKGQVEILVIDHAEKPTSEY
jgi:uncharacterized protein (TIGR03435 family)